MYPDWSQLDVAIGWSYLGVVDQLFELLGVPKVPAPAMRQTRHKTYVVGFAGG